NGKITKTSRPSPKTSFYTLMNGSTNKKIRFATDLYDFAEHFSTVALNNCDFYFKRNYESRFVNVLNKNFSNKIHQLGLTFRVKSEKVRSKSKFKLGILLSNLLLNTRFDKRLIHRIKNSYEVSMNHLKKAEENR